MIEVVGLELTNEQVRAVALYRWGRRVAGRATIDWDPERPADAVNRLRAQFAAPRQLALAVGLGFLHPKQVKLPPVPLAERQRMLALEPDRFFPIQEPALVGLSEGTDLAFAVDAALVERWVNAFEQWAPVVSIEPAPQSLARALGSAAHGTYALPTTPAETGLVTIRHGRLAGVRRTLAEPAGATPPDQYAVAQGAAASLQAPLHTMLLPDRLFSRLRRRRAQQLTGLTALCALSLLFAIWSVDRARERKLQRISNEIAVVSRQATRALELRDRLAAAEREAALVTEIAGRRTDALIVLQALSRRLPRDVTVLNLRATGDEWQIDGTAANAAAIVPLLDRDDHLQDVRFLSATSQYREGNRTYETFSVAFRVQPGD